MFTGGRGGKVVQEEKKKVPTLQKNAKFVAEISPQFWDNVLAKSHDLVRWKIATVCRNSVRNLQLCVPFNT